MNLIQVDVVRLESLQTLFYLCKESCPRESSIFRAWTHPAKDLGRNNHFVALRQLTQDCADNLLTGTERIHIRRIKRRKTRFQSLPNNRSRFVDTNRPLMCTTRWVAKTHAA